MLLYWLLVALSALAPAASRSACTDPECEALNNKGDPYYYDLLETALFNDSRNLYELQRALFPTNGNPRVADKVQVHLVLIVNRLEDDFCGWNRSGGGKPTFTFYGSYSLYHNDYTWHTQVQDESSLDTIADRVLSTATMHEGIIALAKAFGTSRHTYLDQNFEYFDELLYESAPLTIRLDYLKCNPEEYLTENVVRYLLSWVSKVDHYMYA